jgi:hypothetical protein
VILRILLSAPVSTPNADEGGHQGLSLVIKEVKTKELPKVSFAHVHR